MTKIGLRNHRQSQAQINACQRLQMNKMETFELKVIHIFSLNSFSLIKTWNTKGGLSTSWRVREAGVKRDRADEIASVWPLKPSLKGLQCQVSVQKRCGVQVVEIPFY